MDFGDVLFFIVFVIIIIANIMKQLKKAGILTSGKKPSGPPNSGSQPEKKTVWKNVLEQMLEEARKQMENQAEPESAGIPLKHPTGWEGIITEKDAAIRKPEIRPERPKVVRPPVIKEDLMTERSIFQPECMNCSNPMKQITDFGIPNQSGLIYCDDCGEQHKYRILNGELKLMRADGVRKSGTAPERRYLKVEGDFVLPEKIKAAPKPAFSASAELGETRIPLGLTREGLRNAVVWSEILASPLGLRDLER